MFLQGFLPPFGKLSLLIQMEPRRAFSLIFSTDAVLFLQSSFVMHCVVFEWYFSSLFLKARSRVALSQRNIDRGNFVWYLWCIILEFNFNLLCSDARTEEFKNCRRTGSHRNRIRLVQNLSQKYELIRSFDDLTRSCTNSSVRASLLLRWVLALFVAKF